MAKVNDFVCPKCGQGYLADDPYCSDDIIEATDSEPFDMDCEDCGETFKVMVEYIPRYSVF